MSLTVYWASGSSYSWRVLLALELKQIPYESRMLEFSKGDLRTPSFLALNPRGRVPVLADDDYSLYESVAILSYLDRKYPDPPLFGRTARETGLVMRLINEYQAYVDDNAERFILPLYRGEAEEKADQLRATIASLAPELEGFERLVTSSPWLAGASVSAADLILFPTIQSLERAASKPQARAFDIPFYPVASRHPAFAEWMKRVEALPGYERTYPPHWR